MKSKIVKSIAVFMALNILTTAIAPAVSYALTAGPTAPEYSSFEPVDTTDMVNLATGDFTYNIPLLEVPGPEGGYPIALSYHAGINPDEEASWVGLGWTLNPGSISRSVNAYADDINGSSEVVRDQWEGGETKSVSVGIGFGIANGVSAGFGVTIANDTYKGRGIGVNANIGLSGMLTNPAKINVQDGLGTSLGLSMSAGPYNGATNLSLGVGLANPGSGTSLAAGISIYSDNTTASKVSVFASTGISAGPKQMKSSMHASISSNASQPSFGLGAVSANAYSNNSGNVFSEGGSQSVDIPIWITGFSLSLGRSYMRYYIDQTDQTTLYGSLYGGNIPANIDQVSYDCFAFKSPNATYSSDVDEESGGSMPAYDNYMVTGQGIGGGIQPYNFEQGSLFRRVEKDQDDANKNAKPVYFDTSFNPFPNAKVGFRFVNDFSNTFTRELATDYTSAVDVKNRAPLSADIGTEHKKYNDPSFIDFNKSNGMLAGSKHVEWFTNQEIEDYGRTLPGQSEADYLLQLSNLHGFVPDFNSRPNNLAVGGLYGQDVPKQIGGFLICNPTGVSYHYSLPVYNFEEYTEVNSNTDGAYKRTIKKTTPYAYNWLLTALTGPDYVDRAPYGIIDENDWGYWVKLEYGKWTDKYIWRTPSEGAEKDIDSESKIFSAGKKELYYLDAIKTRSHTALFVKDIRRDGKGVGSQMQGEFTVNRDANNNVNGFPAATLRLSRILLYTNRALANEFQSKFPDTHGGPISSASELRMMGDVLHHTYQTMAGSQLVTAVAHNGKGVLDEDDILQASSDMTSSATRQIHFTHNYSLCPETKNSFDINYPNNFSITLPNTFGGKLTLTQIQTNGLGDKKILPATTFEYALPSTLYNKDAKDVWGLYKSDITDNEEVRRKTLQLTSEASKDYVHAWSLNKINTGLGSSINIQYESDKISNSVLDKFSHYALNASNTIKGSDYGSTFNITLDIGKDLTTLPEFQPGKQVQMVVLTNSIYTTASLVPSFIIDVHEPDPSPGSCHASAGTIQSVSSNELIVSAPGVADACNLCYQSVPDQEGNYTYTRKKVVYGSLYLQHENTTEHYGGGLRTKSISVYGDNKEVFTTYTYEEGTTAYEPFDMDIIGSVAVAGTTDGDRKCYRDQIYNFYYAPILSSANFLPSPGVIYKKVSVQDKIRHYDGTAYTEVMGETRDEFEFSVFKETLMPRQQGTSTQTLGDGVKLQVNKIQDYRLQVGLLEKVTRYLNSSTTNPISVNENIYLHQQISTMNQYDQELKSQFGGQGRIDQVYFERKGIGHDAGTRQQNLVVTEIEQYPVVPLGQELTDNKRNLHSKNSTLEFDFYTGNPIVLYATDGYNNSILSKTLPAYTVYPEMTFKVNNPNNKHMLTQNAAAYSYKVIPNTTNPKKEYQFNKIGLLSASAQSWGTGIQVLKYNTDGSTGIIYQPQIYRQQASYAWIGNDEVALNTDGSYPMAGFTEFKFGNPNANSNEWQKLSELTLYDIFSHSLESKDMNNQYSSVLKDPLYQYTLAAAGGARYNEIAYSGCEFNPGVMTNMGAIVYEGRVHRGQGTIVLDKERAHTGNYSLMLPVNQEGFIYSFRPEVNKKYRASVWVHLPGLAEGSSADMNLNNAQLFCRTKTGATIIGSPAIRSRDKKARGHYLIELIIDGNAVPKDVSNNPVEIEVLCKNNQADRSIYFDDFRVHPVTSGLQSYVYDLSMGELTYVLNGNNLYSRFEYDEMGRLKATYKELFRPIEIKVGEQKSNYGSNQ